jgi:predicted NAD/FAD-binding protein
VSRQALPASLQRSIALAVLREAGEDGVTVFELDAAVGGDATDVIEQLRDRGHCVQTRAVDPGRVILHVGKGDA